MAALFKKITEIDRGFGGGLCLPYGRESAALHFARISRKSQMSSLLKNDGDHLMCTIF